MSAELPKSIIKDLAFANGSTHADLGNRVAGLLGIEPEPYIASRFADTDTYARFEDSIRGKHLIAFQTHAPEDGYTVADSFYRHLQMIDAASRSHVSRITAVAPNLAGARQDRQVLPHEAVSADLNLGMLQFAGANHFVTVDIHDKHTLNSFRKPGLTDHLTALPLLREQLKNLMQDDPEAYVMVSPDEGHSKDIRKHAEKLGIELRDMVKTRLPDREVVIHSGKVEGIEGRTCFLMDDMIGTGGTITSAAQRLYDSGASEIIVAATHGWFSPPAVERISEAPISKIYVTDTLPIDNDVYDELTIKQDKLVIVSIDQLIAEGLKNILTGKSVSNYHDGENYA